MDRGEFLKRAGVVGVAMAFPAIARGARAAQGAPTPVGRWIYVGVDPAAPDLAVGWEHVEGDGVRFLVADHGDRRVVHVAGKARADGSNRTVFELPRDCRPARQYRFGMLAVLPDGKVAVYQPTA